MQDHSSFSMRPQLQIWLLIIVLLLFMHSYQAAQDMEIQPDVPFDFHAYDWWLEIASSLYPLNAANKKQNVPSVSNLSLAGGQSRAQAPPSSLDSGLDLLRNLEYLFSEGADKIIRSLELMHYGAIPMNTEPHDTLESALSNFVPSDNMLFTPFLNKSAKFIRTARDDFRARFPLPAAAPGHGERSKRVSMTLDYLHQHVARIAGDHDIERDVIEHHLVYARHFLHDVGVLVGDLAELYPSALEALVLNISAVLLPEATFLRSLVILYCLGPYVLSKDAISGWLVKHVSGDLRV